MSAASSCLEELFNPRSIALIGASATPGKMGYFYLKNLLTYKGKLYAVNPKGGSMLGLRAYKNIRDIGEPIDLAVIVIQSERVLEVARDCGQAGVKVAIVTSAGFGESGPEGKARQQELLRIGAGANMRIVGPNCFGVRNCNAGLNATFSFEESDAAGDVAFVSQSGGGGELVYVQGRNDGLRFSKFMVCGNKADIQDDEVLDYLGSDADTRTICMLVESIKEGRKFFEVARRVSRTKPIVACKIGRTKGASRAAASHTAAMAGNHTAYAAAFKQAGVISARSTQELLDVAKALSWQPLPQGRRLGIITASGGLGVELADLAEEEGLSVPELEPQIKARIAKLIPDFASAENPVDTTPIWGKFAEVIPQVMDALQESERIDVVVPIIVLRATRMTEALEAIRDAVLLQRRVQSRAKPTYVCWVSQRDANANMAIFERARIPCYEWTGRVARAAALACDYGCYRRNDAAAESESC